MLFHSRTLPSPGTVWGYFPENPTPWGDGSKMPMLLERLTEACTLTRFLPPVIRAENTHIASIRCMSDPALRDAIRQSCAQLGQTGLHGRPLHHTLEYLGEAARRSIGLTPYPVQRYAAHLVITGHLAEMATGEGKSLSVALAAACCALCGIPVHIMTANDYLVARDRAQFAPLYTWLGLNAGQITATSPREERRTAYACDITYCTAKEVVFDYLHDKFLRPASNLHWHAQQLFTPPPATALRGLCMAIVDEADSILIDEAKVPLILSQHSQQDDECAARYQALAIARGLHPPNDFEINPQHHQVVLTESGKARIERQASLLPALWHNRRHRDGQIAQALVALNALQRDEDYLVTPQGIEIIDPNTGRIAQGRQWSLGLHQLIELKEGLEPSRLNTTLDALTYQRFFPRYCQLGGVSGTLWEAASELHRVYGRRVRKVPLHQADRRVHFPTRIFPNKTTLWQAVATRTKELQHLGRPVLIGTSTIEESRSLSAILHTEHIAHVMLNASQDADEANVIAHAGRPGQITIATNIAGRGTDIQLAPGVAETGGLHVINCQMNRSRRIDRQLIGRCARHGDPGSTETWLSLDHPLLEKHWPSLLRHHWIERAPCIASPFILAALSWVQKRSEKEDARIRKHTAEQERYLERRLSFSIEAKLAPQRRQTVSKM